MDGSSIAEHATRRRDSFCAGCSGGGKTGAMKREMVDYYDTFVDWDGRLQREMPGLTRALEGCERVLDVGCGTGRHVAALLEAGFDAYGADASDDMLEQAVAFTIKPERFFNWRLGDPPPEGVSYDCVIAMGNVWPQLTDEADIDAAIAGILAVLAPGGRLVLGMKAFEVRRETGNSYMPLLRREHKGEPIWFIRFVDFTPKPPIVEMHMVIVKGEDQCVLHRHGTSRSWSVEELRARLLAGGFSDVKISGKLGEPDVAPTSEDIFVHARA